MYQRTWAYSATVMLLYCGAAPAQPDLLNAAPADAVAVVSLDFRPDSPGLKRVWGGRNAHTFEVLKAWLKAGVHQGLIELSDQLDVEENVTSWLDGRMMVVITRDDEEAPPEVYLVAAVTSPKDAERSLRRIARSAQRRWKKQVKFFDKDGPDGKLYHMIVKGGPAPEELEEKEAAEASVTHVCFTVSGNHLVATGQMAPLERFLNTVSQGEAFGQSTTGRKLKALPEALCKFFVRVSQFSPADLDQLPLPIPGAGIPPFGPPPDWDDDEVAMAEAAEDEEESTEEAAEIGTGAEHGPDGLPEFEEEWADEGMTEELPDFIESVLGSIAYRETGVQYDVAVVLGEDCPDEVRQAMDALGRATHPSPALLSPLPPTALAAIQWSSPAELVEAFGFDLTTAEGWTELLAPGEDATEQVTPVPEVARGLLRGDAVLSLPGLGKVASSSPRDEPPPDLREPEQGGDEVEDDWGSAEDVGLGFDPFDFLPGTLIVRHEGGMPAEPAFAAFRAWLEENSPLRFRLPAGNRTWRIRLGDDEEAAPLAFAACVRSFLIVSRGSAEVTKAIRRIEGGGPSLTDHDNYKEVRAAIGEDAPVQLYLNPVEFIAQGGEIALSEAGRPNPYLRNALELSLGALRGMGASYRVTDQTIHAKAFLGLDYDRLSDLGNVQMMAMFAAIAMPAFVAAREKAAEMAHEDMEPDIDWTEDLEKEPEDVTHDCPDNLAALADAILEFVDANKRYPDANRWTEEIAPYLDGPFRLHCPRDETERPCSYALNKALHRLPAGKVTAPDATILVFDAKGMSRDPHGLGDVMSFRHEGDALVVYCDGHLELHTEAPKAGWEPSGQ